MGLYLVLGLGNPGSRYDRTRHNAGFLVADRLAARWGVPVDRPQFGALTAKARVRSHDVVLAKPQQFMNLSGQAGVSLRGYYKVDNGDVLVVHDEVDLPFGQVKIKKGGGHGGHNGLRDIAGRFGSQDFVRVRVGVSRPPPGWDTADYVLGAWTTAEQAALDEIIDRSADAVDAILDDGVLGAMNRFNVRSAP